MRPTFFSYNLNVKTPTIAVVSFPGNNCEVESLGAVRRAGMEAIFFKWNDSRELLKDVDGYFLVGGFAYEDRGRAGMVAARDPLFDFLHEEAQAGKVIIGNCNGAQVLVESGLIPLDHGLKMSLARNAVGSQAVGFLNEWVWITPTAGRDRCATSDWTGTMHLPIAHGEGRFTTKDPEVIQALKANNQMAFSYCDASGKVSDDPITTPNGSMFAIAGICNPLGNVVALMPHPERTGNGDPYFASMKRWIETKKAPPPVMQSLPDQPWKISKRTAKAQELFIGTIITNNEERTVEQALKRKIPSLKLTQLKYLAPAQGTPESILRHLSLFNPNKETAVVRKGGAFFRWDTVGKKLLPLKDSPLKDSVTLLRRDEPDTGATSLGKGSETGVCYICRGASEEEMTRREVLEVFANPHASTLERMTA